MRLNSLLAFKLDPIGKRKAHSVRKTNSKGDWLPGQASPVVIVKATYRAMGFDAYARLTFLLS